MNNYSHEEIVKAMKDIFEGKRLEDRMKSMLQAEIDLYENMLYNYRECSKHTKDEL